MTGAPTQIDSCTTISSSGTYALTGDVQTNATGDCIRITAPNVVLDGANHTLSGTWDNDGSYSAAVNVTARNVTVTNLRATDFARGVTATSGADGLTVTDVTAEHTWFGVLLGWSSGLDDGVVTDSSMDDVRVGVQIGSFGANNTVENVTVARAWQADVRLLAGATDNGIRRNDVTEVQLLQATGNRLVDNEIHDLWLDDADDNVITGNDVGPPGIDLRNGADGNAIRNNVVLGGIDAIHIMDSSGNRIVGNTVLNASYWGIQLGDAPNTTVRSNRVRGHRTGISVNGAGPVRIVNNTIRNNSNVGIQLYARDVSVVGNDIRNVSEPDSADTAVDLSGVYVLDSDSVVVRDNDVSATRIGVTVHESEDVRVVGNDVTNASYRGISVYDGTRVTAANNELRRTPAGVHGSGSLILRFVNNTVANGSEYGTTVHSSRDVEIRDSRLLGAASVGVRLWNLTDVSVRNVEARDNGNGVRATDVANLTLEDTLAAGNHGYGILVWDADAPRLRGNEVSLNNYGLRIANATNASVAGTVADSNSEAGVLVRSSADARLTNVTATGNNGAGIRLHRANRTTVTRSVADDNYWGVRVTGGRDSVVRTVSATGNRYTGVRLFESTNTTVAGANATENRFGVKVVASDGATFANLTANRNDMAGIRVDDETWKGRGGDRVSDLRLRSLTVRDNGHTGIRLVSTTGTDLRTAAVTGNNKGIWVSSSDVIGLDEVTVNDNTGYPVMVVNGTTVEHAENLTLADGTTLDVSGTNFKVRVQGAHYRPTEPDGYRNVSTWAVVEQTDPEASAVVAMDYTDAAVDEAGVDESTLRLWHYDTVRDEWMKYDTNNSVDTMTNTVSASIETFGTVAPLGELTNSSATASLTATDWAADVTDADMTVAPPAAGEVAE